MSIKQHTEYFNFLCTIQLDHNVRLVRVIVMEFGSQNPLTWNGGAEHVRVDVDEAVYDALLAQSRGADEDERLAAEGRHLLDGLVQHQLRLVEVEVAAHVVVVLPLLPTSLKIVI